MNSPTYNKLLEYMTKLQPEANKKDKKQTYKDILLFINENTLSEPEIQLIFTGDEDKKILGLCEMIGKKSTTGKFKDSARQFVVIIHDLLYNSKSQNKFREEFAIYDDFIKMMLIGEHYIANRTKDAPYARKVLEIVEVVVDKRPGLNMTEYIKKSVIEEIIKGIEELKKVRLNEIEERKKRGSYYDKLVNNPNKIISLEPKTWDEVTKLKNKKLLTTEFLSLNYNLNNGALIDEDKELEEEFINNFVDPLTKNNKKLNFMSFSEADRKKMHIQSDQFDPVFFLEKLYSDVTLKEFANCITNISHNLNESNTEDDNLIDKNIYKYLDCKKLLDFLVEKFKSKSKITFEHFKDSLLNLQNKINVSLNPLKTSFDLILKSKMSKEIIVKFSKFFQMKEKIDHYLKFSNFEELADYLKKINVEIKEISQNRYIYGEFYEFFSKTIEHFKGVLIKIIKESPVNDLVIKHFRYLLEFDVEVETVDLLLNGLKEKMCEKIKNDLEFTENFEIRNFKEFFCDEFNIESLSDDIYSDNLKNSEIFINGITNEKYINDDDFNSKIKEEKKKTLINVESIITTLYKEIKDFLFMMKVLEENINLKIIHLSSKKNTKFSTIVTEVYFTLFEKLKQFLFLSDFDMKEFLTQNYAEKITNKALENLYNQENDKGKALLQFYENSSSTSYTTFNENFNKNTLQNLSNLLIDLFDLFEIYLDRDTLEALNDSKTVTIEKIFMAFLNEKIISNLNICNEDNTINFFDTQLSIFNFSAFSFTKNFLKNIFKSYKNIIEFYRNILIKTKDVNLNHQVIYDSLFFLLKTFLFKFYDFYQTEANGPEDYQKFNCLILEILKNYNYLKLEIKTILKNIFRNKEKEYECYLVDLNNFSDAMKNIFLKNYKTNLSKIIFDLFVPNQCQSSSNLQYNFYEKYNDMLLYDVVDTTSSLPANNNLPIFTDVRSTLIEIILNLAETIKVLFQLETENNNSAIFNEYKNSLKISRQKTSNIDLEHIKATNSKVIIIICEIIKEFLDSLIDYLNINNSKESFIYPTQENLKIISQIYLEIEIFSGFVDGFSNEQIKEKIIFIKKLLISNILIIKKKEDSDEIDEKKIFLQEEVDRKQKVIKEYTSKYSSYLKCFRLKL